MHRLFISVLVIAAAAFSYPQIKIHAVGDVMPGSRTPKEVLPADSGKQFVKSIGRYLQSPGIIFGNFEGAFIKDAMLPCKCSDSLRDLGMCYEFGIPGYLVRPLRELGFNVMNLENNHSRDYGREGFSYTIALLKRNGIQPIVAGKPAVLVNGGDTVCIIGFSQTSAAQNVRNIATAKKLVSDLAMKYRHVIVSFHGGAEGELAKHLPPGGEKFLDEDRGDLRAFAHAVIDAGAHLVIGHGPHVLRAMELYKNKLIAYSLGNFLTYGNFNLQGSTRISCILDVTLDQQSGDLIDGTVIPVVQNGHGCPAYDQNKKCYSLLNQLMRDDIHPNHLFIDAAGKIEKR